MPEYTYKCTRCKLQFDIAQRISEKALQTCQCGGKLAKVIHAPSYIGVTGGTPKFYT